MCIGCENPELKIVSQYSERIFRGEPLNEIARKEGVPRGEIFKKIEAIKEINPEAYQQIWKAIGQDTKTAESV